MIENKESTSEGCASKPSDTQPDSEIARDLTGAIELLNPGQPLVLVEGMVISDSGHLIMSQYVDIGVDKLRHRPSVLVKAIEAEYGLEHAVDIQLSVPYRFRDYGETLVRDDQEGLARREKKTESTSRPYEELNREQEKALRLLGQENLTIKDTVTTSSNRNTESLRFGESSWIYCTSIMPTPEGRDAWRASLPDKYDHESVIRQPSRFALALGAMFADQVGPQRKGGHFTQADGIRSFHDTQMVFHGPMWYTDDVLGFLRSHEENPLYSLYPLFVKHSEFRDNGEYRFVLHCETPVETETLHLYTSGMMRDALKPRCAVSPVTFERFHEGDADSSSQNVAITTSGNKTMTRTQSKWEKHGRTLSVGGEVVQEEVMTKEQVIKLTTKAPADNLPEDENSGDSAIPGKIEITETENGKRRVEGEAVDTFTTSRTRVFFIADTSDADELFTLENSENITELLETVERPFTGFSTLPQQVAEPLKMLARIASELEPDVEVQAMSACWNSIWAICNLYECFGDVVASVDIEQNEFVAITLKEAARTGAKGKILVGPRGTFAYDLMLGDERRPGYGGTKNRLYFFPDEETLSTFEEFGWAPLAGTD